MATINSLIGKKNAFFTEGTAFKDTIFQR